jgi:hypothetical protein
MQVNVTIGEFSRMTHLSVKTLRHYPPGRTARTGRSGRGHQQALGVAGPVRESYLHYRRETADSAAWQTEIGFPIFRTAL